MKEISVNINDWLKERQAGPSGLTYPGTQPQGIHPDQIQLPANATPEQAAAIRREQEQLREKWQEREELAQREHLLDNAPRECVECHASQRHYKQDYICYKCRDKQEGPA